MEGGWKVGGGSNCITYTRSIRYNHRCSTTSFIGSTLKAIASFCDLVIGYTGHLYFLIKQSSSGAVSTMTWRLGVVRWNLANSQKTHLDSRHTGPFPQQTLKSENQQEFRPYINRSTSQCSDGIPGPTCVGIAPITQVSLLSPVAGPEGRAGLFACNRMDLMALVQR